MRNPLQQFALNQLAGIQESLVQAQEEADRELRATKLEGTSGGGLVKAHVNGASEIIDVQIDRSVIDPEESELLQDLVCAAVRDALHKASEMEGEVRREKLRSSGPLAALAQMGFELPEL